MLLKSLENLNCSDFQGFNILDILKLIHVIGKHFCNLGLLVWVQVRVDIQCCLYILVTKSFTNCKRCNSFLYKHTGVAMPLWYNNYKSKKSIFSRILGFVFVIFSLFFPIKTKTSLSSEIMNVILAIKFYYEIIMRFFVETK